MYELAISTETTDTRLSADDKATWARVFAECPTWCDGNEHLEGMEAHQGTIGYVDHVAVSVEQEPGCDVGVVLFAEGMHRRTLTAAQVEEVVVLLRRAVEITEGAKV